MSPFEIPKGQKEKVTTSEQEKKELQVIKNANEKVKSKDEYKVKLEEVFKVFESMDGPPNAAEVAVQQLEEDRKLLDKIEANMSLENRLKTYQELKQILRYLSPSTYEQMEALELERDRSLSYNELYDIIQVTAYNRLIDEVLAHVKSGKKLSEYEGGDGPGDEFQLDWRLNHFDRVTEGAYGAWMEKEKQ